MKYMILIHSNPTTRKVWESFPAEQQAEGYATYAAISNDLAASGELIVAEALADPSTGRRVGAAEGASIASDGPYAEAKEHLVGFFLVECASPERAFEIAAGLPEASYGVIEVRPIMDLGGADM